MYMINNAFQLAMMIHWIDRDIAKLWVNKCIYTKSIVYFERCNIFPLFLKKKKQSHFLSDLIKSW